MKHGEGERHLDKESWNVMILKGLLRTTLLKYTLQCRYSCSTKYMYKHMLKQHQVSPYLVKGIIETLVEAL